MKRLFKHNTSIPYFQTLFALLTLCGWYGCGHADSNQLRERVEKYGTGVISRKYQELNGKKEGLMTDYYADGRLKGERWFKNDQQTGRTVFYFPDGKIKEVQYYQDGKKQGGDSLFYENGRLEFVVEYNQEKKHGYMRKWSPEGALIIEAKYAMDSLVEVKGETVRLDYPATLTGPKAKN